MGPKHLDATCRWLKSAELRSQVDTIFPPTIEGNKKHWQAFWADKSREDYAILNESGIHIGNCGLKQIDINRGKAELWIYLGTDYGQGAGRLAVLLLLKRAFLELKINRVSAIAIKNNKRAVSFYRSIGFMEEGTLRDYTQSDGKYINAVLFAMLAREFSH